ncbi:C2 domain-containing protein 2 [Bufo bufo]|uniref:C2 domain-containing protein 2 n=1 Tax=Bufo bufo TaxID=8384 RepID=UPI001ABE0F39|nr:C2 domain-containing protein 2 [Bufo bufo]
MSWFGEVQWLCLVTLFFASLVTIAVYLVQYVLNVWWKRKAKRPYSGAQSEADSLLSWILSLNSWRSQWLKTWIAALNEEAGKRGGSLRLAFEDDNGPRPLELSVKQVQSVVKSYSDKVVCCTVVGECLQFAVRVTRTLPANSGCQVYSVRITPLHINLELRVKDGAGKDVLVTWSMGNFCDLDLQVQPKTKLEQTPGSSAIRETLEDILKNLMGCVRPQVDLSSKPTDLKEHQNIPGVHFPVICPPKPPRVHELKLQVRNIKAVLSGNVDTSGMVVCSAQLNDPVQRFTTAAIQQSASPGWEEEFVFELNAKSRELQLQMIEPGEPAGGPPLACAIVPLDLFRKNPSGRQNYSLNPDSPLSGSISAQFLFVEPTEVKSWSVPVPAKKVEMDRTVMPCGTVVTTVTSVSSKPRLEGKSPTASCTDKTLDSPSRTPPKIKVIERDFSVQAIPSQPGVVSKVLSSSDTELLMLNGSDPVAEAAIRQLRESSRQSLKSPRKKSTIIISGVSKSVLTQDDEASLMMNYAASMDSTVVNDEPFDDVTKAATSNKGLTLASTSTVPAMSSEDELLDAWEQSSQPGDWNGNGLEDPDSELVSVSNLSMSETGSIRKSKGGFLHKGAKLFFRRRHQQKDPSMSQSHNDLVYLERQGAAEHHKKGGTLTRLLNRKLLPKNKHKNKPPPENA